MHRLNAISLGLCLGAAVVVAHGQEAPPMRGPIPFSVFDKDKNGTISKEEFYAVRGERMGQRAATGGQLRGIAGAPAFEDFDTDGNGQLTEAELRAGQQTRAQQRSFGGRGSGPGMGRNMPTFAEFDLNGDGRLMEEEFIEARNKRIADRVRAGGQMRNLANMPTFADIDTNKDGAITPEEFAAHQRQHRAAPAR